MRNRASRTKQNRGPRAIRGDVRDQARRIVLRWIDEGYTLGAIAEALDVSKSAVHRWKEGDRPVRRLALEIVRDRQTFADHLLHNTEEA